MTTSIFNNHDVRKGDEFRGGGPWFRVALFGGALFVAVILLTSICVSPALAQAM